MKIYSDLPVGESCESHMSIAITACEAGRASLTCPRAQGNDLELRDPCRLTWVPMSCLPVSIGPGIPNLWNLFIDE
jgi:hypothetical protein